MDVIGEPGVRLWVDHTQFMVVEGDDFPAPNSINGLVKAGRAGANIATGVHTGWVLVSVDARTVPPSEAELWAWDLDPWEEVVEVDLRSENGGMRVMSLGLDVSEELVLTAAGPGLYRMRVHARGRDTNPDGVAEEPVEHYHLATWPAKHAGVGEIVLKLTDRIGLERRTAAAIEISHSPRPPLTGLETLPRTNSICDPQPKPGARSGPAAQIDLSAYENLRLHQERYGTVLSDEEQKAEQERQLRRAAQRDFNGESNG
jgi:hypothetical protein